MEPSPAFASQFATCWSIAMLATMSPEVQAEVAAAARALENFENKRNQLLERLRGLAQEMMAGAEVTWTANEEDQREAETFLQEGATGHNSFGEFYAAAMTDFLITQMKAQLA